MAPPTNRVPRAALAELSALLSQGPSLMIVTRDDAFRPEIVRGAAAAVRDDGLVLVAVPVPEGAQAIANLDANGVVALSASRPTTYRTLQVKGAGAARADWSGLDAALARHRAAMTEEVVAVGIPRSTARTMWSRRAIAFAFAPAEIFDQTPGPQAGLPVKR